VHFCGQVVFFLNTPFHYASLPIKLHIGKCRKVLCKLGFSLVVVGFGGFFRFLQGIGSKAEEIFIRYESIGTTSGSNMFIKLVFEPHAEVSIADNVQNFH